MKDALSVATLGLCALLAAGCTQTNLVPVHVELTEELSTFQLLSGETGRHSGVVTFEPGPVASSGTFELDGDHLSIAPAAGPGKGSVNQHEGLGIQVTIRLAPAADVETVCEAGESYGQFTADFDTLNELESITPEQLPLSAATAALIAEGTMSVCVETFPEFSGQVVIGGFTFRLAG
jgi:hypothetical protein